ELQLPNPVMNNCFVNLDFPPLPKAPRGSRWSSICDLHFLVAIVLLTVFMVVLLGFFAYSLTKQETEYEVDSATEAMEQLPVQSGSTINFRKGVTAGSHEGVTFERSKGGLQPPPQPPKKGVPDVSSTTEPSPSWSAAVYSDHKSCSEIGRSILLHGGNAVDAAISAMLCLSAALPHRGGLGGGFMATIYRNSTCTTVNSRETCPSAASEAYFINRRDETVVGPKAIAVPGFLSGLYRIYERFSSKHLSWRQLLTPTIDLCVRGITVSESLSKDLLRFQSMVKNDPLTRSQFINETTRTVLAKGDKMLCPQLANFLSDLSDSENPVDYFYRGEGSTRILKAIKYEDAFLTAQDLDDFETEHQYGLQSHIEDTTLCGPHPPSLFAVVQLAVNAMERSNSTSVNIPLLSWDQSKLVADAIFDSDITKDVAKMTTGKAAKNLLQLLKDGHNPASKVG
ncbi:hypothetical protein V3C99_016928, partial [Haemonchus contortus]